MAHASCTAWAYTLSCGVWGARNGNCTTSAQENLEKVAHDASLAARRKPTNEHRGYWRITWTQYAYDTVDLRVSARPSALEGHAAGGLFRHSQLLPKGEGGVNKKTFLTVKATSQSFFYYINILLFSADSAPQPDGPLLREGCQRKQAQPEAAFLGSSKAAAAVPSSVDYSALLPL